MSLDSSRMGASTIEYGSSHRCSGPVKRRTMCGMTSPTKAIGPHAAVAVPAVSTMASEHHPRLRPTEAPSDRATSSPRPSVSSERHDASATATATTTKGATCRARSPSRPAIEPTAQNRYWSSVSVSNSRIADVNEPSNADSAAPASAIFTGVAPVRPVDPSA